MPAAQVRLLAQRLKPARKNLSTKPVGEVIDFPADEQIEKFVCVDCGGDSFRWYHSCEVEEVFVMECTACDNPFMLVGQVIDENVLSTLH